MSGAADVEISIVNHEGRELTRACLRSLPSACAGLDWRVTVIDNVPGDGTPAMVAAEFPEARIVENRERRGFGANHNLVVSRLVLDSSARHVLVLNNDTELAPGAVTALVSMLDADPRLGAVGPRIDARGQVAADRLRYPTAAEALRMDLGRSFMERPDPDGWLQGSCVLLRVAALAEVGGYDERFFMFFEDCDLCRRLEAAGWRLGICTDAVVAHVGNATVLRSELAAATLRQGQRSRHLYFAKHLGPLRARMIELTGRALLGGRGLAAAARGRREDARHLLGLARYDPRRPLPHERAAPQG